MDRTRLLAAGFATWLGAAGAGCFPNQTDTATTRSQAADADDDTATVGMKTAVGNADPVPVNGVGLVHNLAGTGSSPPPGEARAALEQAILKAKGNPKHLLDDPNKSTSLVLVQAALPPGCRAGDRVDVMVTLPRGSRTSSLAGGRLFPCDLSNSELAGNIRSMIAQAKGDNGNKAQVSSTMPDQAALMGSRVVAAEGALLAGSVEAAKPGDAESPALNVGVIYGGGRALVDRPYYLLLSDASPQPRLALVVAERLNSVFHAAGDRTGKVAEAKVQGRPLVVTHVPPAYRHNHTRYLLVARQVPLAPVEADAPYRQRLEHDLVKPETAITAALKLEALGVESRQALRVGLQSDSPWVRFASAESLAYLGHADGARDLAELAEKHPALRTHALTALASLDDGAATDALVELMRKPDAPLRYGAFRALKLADPRHELVRGQLVNQSYRLHRVAVGGADGDAEGGASLVHVASKGAAEVVLFGAAHPVQGEFSIALGREWTASGRGDGAATVTRVTTKDGEPVAVPVKCRADLGAMLAALGELGGGYTEAVELVRRLEKGESLAVPVAYDSAPRGLTVQALAQLARNDPGARRADGEVDRVGVSEIVAASYELPTEADAVQAKPPEPAAAEPALNRDPGRLFGPSRR